MNRQAEDEEASAVAPALDAEADQARVDDEAAPAVEAPADDAERVRAALGRLKVLSLPSSVLLPGAPLALWLYEPRQRALVQDALAEDGVIGVALSVPPDAQHPRPRLRRVAGAGLVERHRRLPGGAWEVELRGVMRARLASELASPRPYRLMNAEPVDEDHGESPLAPELRRMVLELAPTVVGREAARLARAAVEERDTGVLANLAAAALLDEAEARQAVLEQHEVARRVERVLGELGGLLIERRCGCFGGGLAKG